MESGENLKRKNLPTIQQLQYLTELESLKTERGFVVLIAEKCGVTHGVVSRYLKSCIDHGYLTEDYQFTEFGQAWLNEYRKLMKDLGDYLRSIGIPEHELSENIRTLIENTELHTLKAIVKNYENMMVLKQTGKEKGVPDNLKKELSQYEDWKVHFKIYRMNVGREKRSRDHFSMANRGFEKLALFGKDDAGEYLEFRTREMSAGSRVDGVQMSGRLEHLKYEDHGELKLTEIQDGKLRIPLDAFRLHRGQGGELIGMLPITVTCSVGRTHMPESTALMVVWM